MKRSPRAGVLMAASLLATAPALSHEYWLDPLDATIAPGDPVLAQVRNGEEYAGSSYPFDPARFTRAELIGPQGRRTLDGRLGDYPALRDTAGTAGLHLLVLEAGVRPLAYDDRAAFEQFLDYHGLAEIAARHAGEDLPSDEILERYSRHAKAFIDVQVPGATRVAAGADAQALAAQGLAYELVLEADPYATATTVVRALFDGRPRADAQVELFTRTPDGTVTRQIQRTDAHGRVRFDTGALADYLFNSVQLTRDDQPAAPWRSYWAALTLERSAPIEPSNR